MSRQIGHRKTGEISAKRTSWIASIFGKKHAELTHVNGRYYATSRTYFQEVNRAKWSTRNYEKFADEAFIRNPVAHRSVQLIAQSVASVPWRIEHIENDQRTILTGHPAMNVLMHPNAGCSGVELLERVVSDYLISGNVYIAKIRDNDGQVRELHILRPDRMTIEPGAGGIATAYHYEVEDQVIAYPVNGLTGGSDIIHLKSYHPLSDWYGLSPIEAAAYSIDQHNQASIWNQALLQNGAKPSGALVVNASEEMPGGSLSDEQFERIRAQVDEQFSGSANAGRPLLLEGGLDWKEMSLSPKDMDFMEMKHSAARDIALSFGVPPQLLGIPGDNTYSNLAEARLALWEQTVLPLLDKIASSLNHGLVSEYRGPLELRYDLENVQALSPRRQARMERINATDFMTVNEKRQAIGLQTIEGGDAL